MSLSRGPHGNRGPQPIEEQGAVTGKYRVDYNSLEQQFKRRAAHTPFFLPEAAGNTKTMGIQLYDPLFRLRAEGSSLKSNRNMSSRHLKCIGTLNGVQLPQPVDNLLRRLRNQEGTEEARREILNGEFQFIGVAHDHAGFSSEPHGNTGSDLRAVMFTGVSLVAARTDLPAATPVRFCVPIREVYEDENFFGRMDEERQQRYRITMYAEPVDPFNTYKTWRSLVKSYFLNSQWIKSILHNSSEQERYMMPAFAFPEHLQRFAQTCMILGQYAGIRSGVLQTTPPQSTGNNRYASGMTSRPPSEVGYRAYYYGDALHFVSNQAGATAFPSDGETAINNVRAFGNSFNRNVSADDAAFEYLIAAMQLANLAVPSEPPTNPDSGSYASEGFYFNVRDDNNVRRQAGKRFRDLLGASCQNLASLMFTNEQHAKSFVGYDPATGVNRRVMNVGRDVTIDKHRDAGATALAVSQALPSMLRVASASARELNASHGIVVVGANRKGTAQVYIGRGAH